MVSAVTREAQADMCVWIRRVRMFVIGLLCGNVCAYGSSLYLHLGIYISQQKLNLAV